MKPTLLILQGSLPDYRRGAFNRLADEYRTIVVHAGVSTRKSNDVFEEVVIPDRRVGPFHIQSQRAIADLASAADITIAMFDLAWPAYMALAFRPSKRGRFILWGHRYGARPLANRVRDVLMKRADAVLLYGPEHTSEMIRRGIPGNRIFIAPNTVDIKNHCDLSRANKSTVLFVGRLQERKRLKIALRAFAGVAAQIPESWTFDIVGDGDAYRELSACAEALGCGSRVKFHGEINDEERLLKLYASAAAYVSPGAVGLSVLHSFAYGVPVLTLRDNYHGPEFHNLVHDENGYVASDEADFNHALARLIQDVSFAQRLGHAAYERYSTERTIDHMVDGFREAIDIDRA